jgi:hypothetical protein
MTFRLKLVKRYDKFNTVLGTYFKDRQHFIGFLNESPRFMGMASIVASKIKIELFDANGFLLAAIKLNDISKAYINPNNPNELNFETLTGVFAFSKNIALSCFP